MQFSTNNETHEMILSGLGEQHLDVAVSKLKSKFGVDVTLKKTQGPLPRDHPQDRAGPGPAQEAGPAAHGQFGDVWIEFSPCDSEGLEFGERVVGGSVPKGFFPAVEKGLRECIQRGPLAGYPCGGPCPPCYTTALTTRWTPQKWPLRRRRPWPIRRACPRPTLCCWSPSAT